MIYYSSIHPERDYFRKNKDPQTGEISELLEAIALMHSRNTEGCVERLEELGIVLGSNSFEVALIQKNPLGSVLGSDTQWHQRVVACGKKAMTGVIWYCFSTGGKLYLLCCYPRMAEGSPETEPEKRRLYDCFERFFTYLEEPNVRIILSDMLAGTNAVFRCFNNLHHAMEYLDYREMTSGVIQLDSERQLHGAFIEDMSAYRKLSVSIADELVQDDCQPEILAKQVGDLLMENSAPSMESVHHHLQTFILTFTEYLGSTGLIDSAYIKRKQIVYRVMGFETQREMYARLQSILEDLVAQYRKLRDIGKQERIQSVRIYVEKHITDSELTIAGISERFSIGAPQLAKQFSHYYGVSLYKYMQQCRFRLATTKIREQPNRPIHEIAMEVGYADVSTMYRAFRQMGNTTPGAVKLAAMGTKQGEL